MCCGRKETRNKYSEAQRRAWERYVAGNGGRGPHRGLELELDGSPARKIHIFKYFSHGPQSPRHAALPPTACYPLRTYYLPGTCLGIAAGTPRVSGFLVTRCCSVSFYFFSPSFPCNYPAYYGAQHASPLFLDRSVRVLRVYHRIARFQRSRESFCWSKRFDCTGKCNRRNRLHRCCDVVFDGRC